jgi:hypothetical protein
MEIWMSWTAVSAAAVMIYWMHLRYGGRKGKADTEALQASLDELRGEVDQLYVDMHDRIEATNERVDFAERLLAQRRPERVEEEANTPV